MNNSCCVQVKLLIRVHLVIAIFSLQSFHHPIRSARGSTKGGKSAPAKGGAKGKGGKGGKGKSKDDISVKSEKIARGKGAKPVGGDKRRVKSARRAGKSVSFVDEQSEQTTVLEVSPAVDSLAAEDPIQPPAVSNSSHFDQ